MKKLSIIALAVMACSPTMAATMASQPWVTNRIAEAEARVDAKITAATNAIPAPGDYATVSNRAMSALQSHQPLTPATNYTDTAVSAMGSVLRNTIAESARASTNYTDAIAAEFADGTRTVQQANFASEASSASDASYLGGYDGRWYLQESTNAARAVVGPATNGLPEAIGRKQARLPYPTNAIPYAAISGAPSGGWQEWRVDNQSSYEIHYVTNGMATVQMGAELSCNTNGWGDGAAMFARFTIQSGLSYEVMDPRIRLVGYGTWPTNNFQSVWWRSGTNIFVNILVEE